LHDKGPSVGLSLTPGKPVLPRRPKRVHLLERVEASTPEGRTFDRPLSALLWASALCFVAHRALQPLAETDLFFHLKLGDLIRGEPGIRFRTLFSYTLP